MQPVARVAAAIVIALLAPRTAQADCDDATHHRGMDLRSQGDNAGALAVFEGLWRAHHERCALARIALAEAALLRLVEAEEHLRAALDDANDPWIAANRVALQTFLDEQLTPRLGTLTVASSTPGAELWIDGAAAGALAPSVTRRVPAGTVHFEVRAPGYIARASSVVVDAREVVSERIDLTRSPNAPSLPLRAAPGPSPFVWIGGGVALAAAGTAVALGLRGNDVVADYDARCVDREPAIDTDCHALRRDTQASLDGSALAVNALWGVAALGAATAAVGAILSLRRATPDTPSPRVSVALGARSAGLSVQW